MYERLRGQLFDADQATKGNVAHPPVYKSSEPRGGGEPRMVCTRHYPRSGGNVMHGSESNLIQYANNKKFATRSPE